MHVFNLPRDDEVSGVVGFILVFLGLLRGGVCVCAIRPQLKAADLLCCPKMVGI